MLDTELVKLQYEILNVSLETLADNLNLPLAILKTEAECNNWKQWWPSEGPLESLKALNDEDISEDPAEILELQSEQYLASTRKRLIVYSLAKEIFLAKKYASLESALLDKAKDILGEVKTLEPNAVKIIAGIYKDLTAKSYTTALRSMSLDPDDNGLPTVIIRDLSGGARGSV